MVSGAPLKLIVGPGAMVTVAVAVTVPPAPVAVIVYVVVDVGLTARLPDVATAPMP